MRRPPMAWSWRDAMLIAWLLVTIALLPTGQPTRAVPSHHGVVRQADMKALHERVRSGRLSTKPARWVEALDQPQRSDARPRAPAALHQHLQNGPAQRPGPAP